VDAARVAAAGVAVRTTRATVALVLFALATRATPARAEACPDPRDAAGGPMPGGTDGADFGAIPEACRGTDLGLRLRASALVASNMPDYYGNVAGTATLRLRYGLGHDGRFWLSLAADVTTFRYVANAVVTSTAFSLGPATLGLHRSIGEWERTAASVYARALLPLDTARVSGVRLGFELGVTGRRALGASERFGLQGGVAVLSPLVVVAGQTHAALEPVALAEGWFAPRPRFALFAGLATRLEGSPDPTFLSLAPRLAARLALRSGLSFSLLAEAPVAGEDRTNLVVALFAGWAAAR
jgi:hypothetical protein